MRTTIYIFILLLLVPLIIFPVLTIKNRDQVKVTVYSLDSDQADYAMGTIMYESKSYNTNYNEHRAYALEKLERSASHGFSPAQYYLGKLYLTDALMIDTAKGIQLIKKAATQNEKGAIKYLVDNKIPFKMPHAQPLEYKYNFYIVQLILIHIVLSMLLSYWSFKKEIFNFKKIIMIWFLPYVGGILALLLSIKKE